MKIFFYLIGLGIALQLLAGGFAGVDGARSRDMFGLPDTLAAWVWCGGSGLYSLAALWLFVRGLWLIFTLATRAR